MFSKGAVVSKLLCIELAYFQILMPTINPSHRFPVSLWISTSFLKGLTAPQRENNSSTALKSRC